MVKHFCDICGQEIDEKADPKLGKDEVRMTVEIVSRDKKNGFRIQVMHASTSPVSDAPVWNRGDICKYCIIDAVARLDDRPVKQH